MPFYQRLGDVPRKRHIQFRENGTLLTEEVMGLEGFTGNEWILDKHGHRLFNTKDVDAEGDEITGRRVLMWNDDVEISLCRPAEQADYFFRNGEGDEVIFVHEGTGTLET